jgi:hypothetical protein
MKTSCKMKSKNFYTGTRDASLGPSKSCKPTPANGMHQQLVGTVDGERVRMCLDRHDIIHPANFVAWCRKVDFSFGSEEPSAQKSRDGPISKFKKPNLVQTHAKMSSISRDVREIVNTDSEGKYDFKIGNRLQSYLAFKRTHN